MLAVPGIEKSHWTTRAFFFGAILFAIGGVLIGAISQTLFNLFFGEDLYVHSNHIRNEHNMLTWKNHRRLLLRIWDIFSFQTEVGASSSLPDSSVLIPLYHTTFLCSPSYGRLSFSLPASSLS